MNINNQGVLYIVATPMGNIQDITLRAIDVLKSVNLIAAEDTRHSAPLLNSYGITTSLISLHDFNERERTVTLLGHLSEGKAIALISDAGTPLISDPGYFLVREAREAGFKVVPIPGPSALIAALSASGLPTDRFVFEGFLPIKTKARTDRLQELVTESRTIIFYEAPHRILDVLNDLKKVFGDERKAVIARELTKKFETIFGAPLKKLLEWAEKDANQQRGEFVLLVEGAEKTISSEESEKILKILLEYLPLKKAVEAAAEITGARKNDLYERALLLKRD